jgi:D-glycero-alpha-D-manno-heptose-7-phosphate kinase
MIITHSPLRISLGGGGTDLPSYYRDHGGFVISAAIDRYVYITLHETFVEYLIAKYSEMERVTSVDDVRHPLIREALKLTGTVAPGLEIASMSDIPAGTGLGSSGSFTTALLYALLVLKRQSISKHDLAEMACRIELDILHEPIGKQDQYISAFGGLTCFEFHKDDRVVARPLRISAETLHDLEDNLAIFFTGYSRSASSILKDQDEKSKHSDPAMIANLHRVKDLGLRTLRAFESGNLAEFAEIMNEHWEHKRKRSTGISNPKIDEWYQLARANGALGGKLIGAGGGGFLMFYASDKRRLRHALTVAGMREVRFRFDFEGTKVVTS